MIEIKAPEAPESYRDAAEGGRERAAPADRQTARPAPPPGIVPDRNIHAAVTGSARGAARQRVVGAAHTDALSAAQSVDTAQDPLSSDPYLHFTWANAWTLFIVLVAHWIAGMTGFYLASLWQQAYGYKP
jgi:hypothetical protein